MEWQLKEEGAPDLDLLRMGRSWGCGSCEEGTHSRLRGPYTWRPRAEEFWGLPSHLHPGETKEPPEHHCPLACTALPRQNAGLLPGKRSFPLPWSPRTSCQLPPLGNRLAAHPPLEARLLLPKELITWNFKTCLHLRLSPAATPHPLTQSYLLRLFLSDKPLGTFWFVLSCSAPLCSKPYPHVWSSSSGNRTGLSLAFLWLGRSCTPRTAVASPLGETGDEETSRQLSGPRAGLA